MSEITKYRDSEFEPFVLDDGTGTAYVDPTDAELLLENDREVSVDDGDHPPPYVAEFLDRETDVDPVGRHTRHYRESRLDVGEDVRVGGQADPDAVPALDDPPRTAVVAAGDAPKFLVSDDADVGLGRRLLHEASLYFLVAAICLGISYFLLFVQ